MANALSLRIVVIVCAVSSACRCTSMTMTVDSQVRASSASIDFGRVFVGGRSTQVVELSNTGAASLELHVTNSAPFVTVNDLVLPGGSAVPLEVAFAPTSAGPQAGTLTVSWSGGTVDIEVAGEGVSVPACRAEACHTSTFSFDAGVCVSTVQPDDSPCSVACGAAGVCVSGLCRAASAPACDDRNPCTIDACSASGGCVHVEAPLPVSDPCQVLHCDPDAGVVSEPAEDGLSCGDRTCRSVQVCLNGACVTRPSGNADDDCSYVDVDPGGTCFVTRSGRMRCFTTQDGGEVALAFVPGASRVKWAFSPRWIDQDDTLQPSNLFVDAGFTTFRELQLNPFGSLRAVTGSGQLVSRDRMSNTTTVALDAGVAGLCGAWQGVRMSDGGVELEGGLSVPAGAVDCVSPYGSFDSRLWFLLANGTVVDETGAVMARGVTRLPRYLGDVLARGAALFRRLPDGGELALPSWPELPERVSIASVFDHRFCGTSSSGNAWCLGGLPGTPLSKDPNRPLTLLQGPWDAVDPLRTGAQTWRAGARRADAGASTLSLEHDWGQRRVDRSSANCVLSRGELWCAELDGGERLVGTDVMTLESDCGVTAAGRMLCSSGVERADVLPGSSELVWFPRDGGVSTRSYLTDAGVLDLRNPWVASYPLAAPPTDVSSRPSLHGGCWVAQAQVYCSENGSAPERKSVRFPARRVTGGVRRGCAVIGSNRVECWGVEAKFRAVQFEKALVDLEAPVWGSDTFTACVLQVGGEVRCFGTNQSGLLGVQPNDFQAFERVDQ